MPCFACSSTSCGWVESFPCQLITVQRTMFSILSLPFTFSLSPLLPFLLPSFRVCAFVESLYQV
eukprot:m.382745 g.382745  ORF g.382745 m.382745 type:complete len:64 (-) comp118526_c0_seq1:2-193(-)